MKQLVFLATLLTSTYAYSAITITQQNLIPEAAKSEVILKAEILGAAYENESDRKLNAGGLGIGLSYFYGFSENQAVGVYTTLENQKVKGTGGGTADSESTVKGMQDIRVLYKGNFEVGPTTLFVHAGFVLPPGDMKAKQTSATDTEMTATRGQKALIATVGLIEPVGSLELGALATYQKNAEGKLVLEDQSGSSVTYDTKKGDIFLASIYAELVGDLNLNFAANYERIQDMTYNTGTFQGQEKLIFTGGMRTSLNEVTELVGAAGVGMLLNKDHLDIKSYAQVELDLGIRISY
ncbi:hypothetical protein [Bdellovibrio sp. HCB288]|uniref:hypothetical protein n=1 Tax=Bdellovibrio sp. HCB288 TaxID=3394355 RepID=UPI0039B3930A